MNQKTKYITGIVLSVLVICALTIPAFALTESDVQSQVSASGKEGVALCWQKRCWPRGASLPPVVLLAAVEAAMQAEEEVPVAAAAAVTATPSCKAVWPVSSTAASITAHTKALLAQAAAALAAWRSVPP